VQVKDLIEYLQKVDPDARVCAYGHFGEELEVKLLSFQYWETLGTLEIPCIDKGEEPE